MRDLLTCKSRLYYALGLYPDEGHDRIERQYEWRIDDYREYLEGLGYQVKIDILKSFQSEETNDNLVNIVIYWSKDRVKSKELTINFKEI